MTSDDTLQFIELLEGAGQDLKAQLENATTQNAKLIDLADRLQKQNEVLMLQAPKPTGWKRLRGI